MDKTEIKYISLLAPLFYLYGTIFLWAKNAHMFLLSQFAYSAVFIFAVAVVLYYLVFVLLSTIQSKIKYSKVMQIGIALFIAVLLGLIGQLCFLKIIFTPYHHAVMWGIIVFIFLTVYFNFTQKIIIFLLMLLFFASSSFVYNFYEASVKNNELSKEMEQKASKDEYLVEFKNKPNIYLFWLESFQGTRTLKNVFNVDITPLSNYLNEQNFSLRENIYSTSCWTLWSMVDVYSLGLRKENMETGLGDSSFFLRKLIGGGEGNNVLKVLKYNGYTTNIITEDYYHFYFKEKYLDYSWVIDNTPVPYLLKLLPCYAFTRINLFPRINWQGNLSRTISRKERIENEINKMQKENTPYFLAWKGGLFHVALDRYNYNNQDDVEQFIISYNNTLEKEIIMETKEIISMILKKDKNALIVMLGDHGTHRYWGIENLDKITKKGIKRTDFIDSLFNVFAAVHLPEQYTKFSFDDNNGIYINHSNIFVHIFSLLADDPKYLTLQKMPVSNFDGQLVIKNGNLTEKLIDNIQ